MEVKRRPKDLRLDYLTQALIGNAYFSHYLHRMKRSPDAECMYTSNTCRTRLNTQFLIVYILRTTSGIVLKAFVGNRNITSSLEGRSKFSVRPHRCSVSRKYQWLSTLYRLPPDVQLGPSSMTRLRTYYAAKTGREDSWVWSKNQTTIVVVQTDWALYSDKHIRVQ